MNATAHRIGAMVAAAWILASGLPGRAAEKPATAARIDFKVMLLAEDPFSPMNELGLAKQEFRRGEIVRLVIAGTPRPGFHTYPITQRSYEQPEGMLTTLIDFKESPGLKRLFPIHESKPESKLAPGVGVILEYEKPFFWTQDILVLPDALPGPITVRFVINIQVCNDSSCLWGKHPYEMTINVSDAPPVPLSPELEKRMAAKPEITVVLVWQDTARKTTEVITGDGPTKSDGSFLGMILASMAAAIAMLFTPCVFPMIPITVSFFLKQSEKKHHNPLLTAAVYSLTIIIVLSLAVLVLGQLIVTLANNAWLNLGLGAVLIFFALSLFGMYEIELPAGLAQYTASREGRGGYFGAVFMALTFTITSFTCTGPFLGPLLVGAKEFQLSLGKLIIASLAYSTTFAAPFFVLALFPGMLKALPKSGGWLNSVKVVMGFLELGAALKFLGNTDIALNPGNPLFFNYETVLCAWIVLSVACGLYLLGVFRLPHDSPVESIGVARMLLATVFLGLALYLTPALWREKPIGAIGDAAVAFLPLDTKERTAGRAGGSQPHLDWHLDYEKAWAQAVKENKLIFIDFTGVNCTNCRDNEQRVFPKPKVRNVLEKYVRVQLYNDIVPKSGLSRDQAKAEAERNLKWQEATFHDVTTPLYAVVRPAKDKPFDGDKLNGEVLYVRGGAIPNDKIETFAQNLQAPLDTQLAQAKLVSK